MENQISEKTKILIIAFFFPPSNTIGAIRPSKLAKYLSKTGKYEITVICANPFKEDVDTTRNEDLKYIHKVIRVDQWCIWWWIKKRLMKIFPNHEKSFARKHDINPEKRGDYKFFSVIKKKIRDGAEWINEEIDAIYRRRAEKELSKLDEAFDVVLSSSFPLSSHELAYTYKKKYPNTKWIADFRDPIYQIDYKFCGKKLNYLEIEHLIGRESDCMLGVVDACFYKNNDKIRILNNGFDPDDLIAANSKLWTDGKFHIVYTGRLYPQRKCDKLFSALRDLSKENKVDLSKIEFNYAGTTYFRLEEQAKEYGVSCIIKDMGVVEHQMALSMQQSSQLLVALTWNDTQLQNVLTGKLYEYMFSGRPMLALVSGTVANSSTKQIVNDYNLGFCYEDAGNEDILGVKEYFKSLYEEFVESGNTTVNTNWEKVYESSYENRAKELEQIIMNM